MDEIGNLPLALQAKLLTVLQNRNITRIGSNKVIPVDIRLISATNKDIPEMIKEGLFREDLFYRINTIHLEIPPLRERGDDLLLFIDAFLHRFASKYQRPEMRMHEQTIEKLRFYHWPGNIRELRNVLIRALSLCSGNQITLTDLPPELRQQAIAEPAGTDGKLQSVVKNSEAQTILLALGDHHWNVAKTARALGISRASMYEKMRKFGIRRPPSGF